MSYLLLLVSIWPRDLDVRKWLPSSGGVVGVVEREVRTLGGLWLTIA